MKDKFDTLLEDLMAQIDYDYYKQLFEETAEEPEMVKFRREELLSIIREWYEREITNIN